MRRERPSLSAQTVALARSHLHWSGTIDDPWAYRFLSPTLRLAARVLRLRAFSKYGRSPTFSFLAARTLFFDEAVSVALDDGVRQVVIVGAGYDSQAWRLARPGARFFEVDRPATLERKRRHQPGDAAMLIPMDLVEHPLDERLVDAGLVPTHPSVFIVEGLTMYLGQDHAQAMFEALASVAGEGSRLAANFTTKGGGSVSPLSRGLARVARAAWRWWGEPTQSWATRGNILPLLSRTGWELIETLTGPELVARYLSETDMAITGVNPEVSCVSASRTSIARRQLPQHVHELGRGRARSSDVSARAPVSPIRKSETHRSWTPTAQGRSGPELTFSLALSASR